MKKKFQTSLTDLRFLPSFLLIAVFYFRKALWAGRVAFPAGGDQEHTYFSSLQYFHDWIRQGVIPWWNTLSLCGQPYGLHSVSLFDLYHLAAAFFPVPTAYNAVLFSGFFLNGACLYFFLRHRGLSGFSAWSGGAVWMITMAQSPESGFFFLPLCFLLAERFSAGFGRADFAWLTLSLAAFALNANPQYFLYGGLVLFAYVWFGSSRSGFSRAKRLGWSVLPFGIAGGLVFFHFWRIVELALQSTRQAWGNVQFLSPFHFATALFPKLYEPALRPDLGFIPHRIFEEVFSRIPFVNAYSLGFLSLPYTGILSLLAVGFCVARLGRPRERFTRFFIVVLALVGLYLSLHPLIYLGVTRHIPFLSGMTNVVRLFDLYRFCLAVLTAVAMEAWVQKGEACHGSVKKTLGVLAVVAGAVAIVLAGVSLWVFQFRESLMPRIVRGLREFQDQRVPDFFDFFKTLVPWQNLNLIGPIAGLFVLCALFYFFRRGKLGVRSFMAALAVFILVDLFSVLGFAMPSSPVDQVRGYQEIADFLKRDTSLFRVMSVESREVPFSRIFLRPETNVTYGIATPDGYEQLYQRRYGRFYGWLTRRPRDPIYILHATDSFQDDLADFLNCKYVVTSAANPLLDRKEGYKKVFEGLSHKVYLNQGALERVFVARKVFNAKSREDAERFILQDPAALKDTVVLENGSSEPVSAPPAVPGRDTLVVEMYRPNDVQIRAELSADGYVVLSDTFYPGWSAWVDGKPASVERADYAFRAVRVAQGAHTLRLTYRPAGFILGFAAFLASLLAFFWACVIIRCHG